MNNRPLSSATSLDQEVIKWYKCTWSCASLSVFHSEELESSAVDVTLQGIYLRLHSIWSINPR